MPLLSRVVPNIPFVAPGNAALVSPNVRVAVHKLIDIEFQSLRGSKLIAKKINVIHKIVRRRIDAVTAIGYALRREWSDQVVVPQYIGVFDLSTDRELHGPATQRGRIHALTARPRRLRPTGRT